MKKKRQQQKHLFWKWNADNNFQEHLMAILMMINIHDRS